MEQQEIIEEFRPATIEEVFEGWDAATIQEAMERVRRGMAWQDEHTPGWMNKFWQQKEQFSMGSAKACVLGLTHGDFYKRITRDGEESRPGFLTHEEAVRHGFQEATAAGLSEDGISFNHLQRMWSYMIEDRMGVFHVVPRDDPNSAPI